MHRFLAALSLALALPLAAWGQAAKYKPGDRVEVDVIMAGAPERGMWRAGTVRSIERGEYVVQTDPSDAGGRTIRIGTRFEAKWLRANLQPAPVAEPAQPGTPAASAKTSSRPFAAAQPPAVPEGILSCPVVQPKSAAGSQPEPRVLQELIRCLFERRAASPSERSVKVDIFSFELGTPRDCVPRQDFGCGNPVFRVQPALVKWRKTDYYAASMQVSENESVFDCHLDAFGFWQCALGKRIRDGELRSFAR